MLLPSGKKGMRKLLVGIVFLFSVLPAFSENTQTVAVLLDVSKSVPPEHFLKGKQIIRDLTNQATATDKISIYAFGDNLRRVDPSNLDSLQATESYTLLFDAAYDVARELGKDNSDHKAILIISDGKDTKSATILEDIVAYANANGISIYSIGVGKAEQKSFERIAKLTDGKFFLLDEPSIPEEFRMLVSQQQKAPEETNSASVMKPVSPVAVPPPVPLQEKGAISKTQTTPETREKVPIIWIAAIGAVVLLLSFVFFLVRSSSRSKKYCPTCGRIMTKNQAECPYCTGTLDERVSGDGTQELFKHSGSEQFEELIPSELLEKKPEFDISLTKTYVLMETPVLVVRKGTNIGQTFSLNRLYPVSIGRSRVNEIRLEDAAVSGQHCRILPESGKHVLYDLSSTNGTFLNDKKISKESLKEGDVIRIGETQFLYRVEQHGA